MIHFYLTSHVGACRALLLPWKCCRALQLASGTASLWQRALPLGNPPPCCTLTPSRELGKFLHANLCHNASPRSGGERHIITPRDPWKQYWKYMTFCFCFMAGTIWTERTCMLERNTAATTELHVADVYFPMRRITVITDKSIIANNKQQCKQAHTGAHPPTAKKCTHKNCHSASFTFNGPHICSVGPQTPLGRLPIQMACQV